MLQRWYLLLGCIYNFVMNINVYLNYVVFKSCMEKIDYGKVKDAYILTFKVFVKKNISLSN